jgi:hypothetical protein
VQQILDWQPFTSFTTRDEDDELGAVLTLTTVFTPVEGGTRVTAHFVCEPEEAWDQIEAAFGPSFERSAVKLSTILDERTESIE